MLLIPFVENAFKHGQIENIEHGWVSISIQSTKRWLLFNIANSKPKRSYTKDRIGGIGLNNVRRRLELQYPGLHKIKIQNHPHIFEVTLKLALQ